MGYSSADDASFTVTFCKKYRSEPQSILILVSYHKNRTIFLMNFPLFKNLSHRKPVKSLLQLCCNCFVLSVYTDEIHPGHPAKIPGTYNPAEYDRAYYYTDLGQQLRHMRSFPIESSSEIRSCLLLYRSWSTVKTYA